MIYYVAQTNINPLGLAFALVMGVLLVVLPRRYAVIPILMLICYMTMGTNIVVGGLNFTMLRLLLVFAWTRLVVRGEIRDLRLNRIDKAVIAFVISSLITYTLLWGTYDAFKNKLGLAYSVLGFFFLFRYLLRDFKDGIRVIRIAAVLIVPLALVMLLEKVTGHNSFAPLGGVPAISAVREGVTRCQGPFSHPILAGSFGATLLPIFGSLWAQKDKAAKLLACLGVVASAIIVFCAGSSGPMMAAMTGLVGLLAWPIRYKMRSVRWGIVALLLVLHLSMKAPVWFIIARIDIFSGNTGWHRAHLIDVAIRNLSDWWLVGTQSNENWDVFYDHNYDITNQYIAYGIDGGLITFSLFILIIVRCFSGVGTTLRALQDQPQSTQMFLWALGAALLAHTANYFSISYFDQNIIAFYMLLAMISSLSNYAFRLRRSFSLVEIPRLQEVTLDSYAQTTI
jgi:hypothetical protein